MIIFSLPEREREDVRKERKRGRDEHAKRLSIAFPLLLPFLKPERPMNMPKSRWLHEQKESYKDKFGTEGSKTASTFHSRFDIITVHTHVDFS